MEYCEFYLKGKAKYGNELEKDLLICNEECPYGNQRELTFGETVSICKTKGSIKNKNNFNQKREDLFGEYFRGNSI